jgi:hypothetical protein
MITGFKDIMLFTKIVIITSQLVFIVDIFLNFFVAIRKQGYGKELLLEQKQIMKMYLKEKFIYDIVLTVPFGLFFHESVKYLHLIKVFRTREVISYF